MIVQRKNDDLYLPFYRVRAGGVYNMLYAQYITAKLLEYKEDYKYNYNIVFDNYTSRRVGD